MLIPLPCHKSQILMTDLGLSDSNKNGIKKRQPLARTVPMKGGVVPLGVEPRTHGFSVHCSTT